MELLVKFIEVHYNIAGTCQDEVSFMLDREVQIVPFVGKDG